MKIFTIVTNIIAAILCFLSLNPFLIPFGIITIFLSIYVATDCFKDKERLGIILHSFIRWPVIIINVPFIIIILIFEKFVDFTKGISYKYGKFLLKKLKIDMASFYLKKN